MKYPIERRKISELGIRRYGDVLDNRKIMCEPTLMDIYDAVKSSNSEARNYQTDLDALKEEWLQECKRSLDPYGTWQQLVSQYHARRIAYFVVNGWSQPIEINQNNELTDGTHRIKAAIFKGHTEVDVIVK